MRTFFTADYHLGHANIIKYCNRPFTDVHNMNYSIIRNHNNRVLPGDTVFFVGDFCFRNSPGGKQGEGIIHKAEFYIRQLNGRFVFIKGNHDDNNSLKTKIEKIVINYGGHRTCLVHNPIHADLNYEFNFVGHVHEKWKFRKLNDKSWMINVGVDAWNFVPISFEEIMKDFRKWRKSNKHIQPEVKVSEEK